MIDDAQFASEAKALFREYQEWFGLANADFPEERPQDEQAKFEDKFELLICKHEGHNMVPDQCMKPEHDYCENCRTLRGSITGWIASDFRSPRIPATSIAPAIRKPQTRSRTRSCFCTFCGWKGRQREGSYSKKRCPKCGGIVLVE